MTPLSILQLSFSLLGLDDPRRWWTAYAEHSQLILFFPVSEQVKTTCLSFRSGGVPELRDYRRCLCRILLRLQSQGQNWIVEICILLLVAVRRASLLPVQLYDVSAAHIVESVRVSQIQVPPAVMKVVV